MPTFQSSLRLSELPLPMEATSGLFLLSGRCSLPRRDPGLGLSRGRVQLTGVLTQHWAALRRTSVLTPTVELCPRVWDLEDSTPGMVRVHPVHGAQPQLPLARAEAEPAPGGRCAPREAAERLRHWPGSPARLCLFLPRPREGSLVRQR